MKILKILLACEESQIVTKAFRRKGHEAYSCDLQECSGGHPEWHWQCDVREVLQEYFDLVIFHPPCTYMANSGVLHLHKEQWRWLYLYEGCQFFNLRHEFNSDHVATENPIPHLYAVGQIGKYNQLIQPYQFGHMESKGTCFWLKNLPRLNPTRNVYKEMMKLHKRDRMKGWWLGGGHAKERSKTFTGIAEAIADQWSKAVSEDYKDMKTLF